MATVTLPNGVEMPALGFGCAFGNWTNADEFLGFTPEEAWPAIAKAIRAGFKHFDTALVYGTQRALGTQLGMAYADGTLRRSDVFITTKVFHPPAGIALNTLGNTLDMTDTAIDVPARVRHDVERCLDELGHGRVDLLLMHWPGAGSDAALNRSLRRQCWRVFEELYERKLTRAIGVSNFTARHLQQLLEDGCAVRPHVNQVEVSPYYANAETVDFCKEHGIVVEAWAPFGSGATGVLQDTLLNDLAAKHGRNVGQVVLRWLSQRGIVSLPKSSSLERMRSNLDIFDFELTADEVGQISALDKGRSSVPSNEASTIA